MTTQMRMRTRISSRAIRFGLLGLSAHERTLTMTEWGRLPSGALGWKADIHAWFGPPAQERTFGLTVEGGEETQGSLKINGQLLRDADR
ncbi:MAG: hypothetical protein ACYDD1_03225 [Caulobacteraceae bacterium]